MEIIEKLKSQTDLDYAKQCIYLFYLLQQQNNCNFIFLAFIFLSYLSF